MSCSAAKFDPDEGRYQCDVSGNGCMYMIPDSKRCAEDWGEGPDVDNGESKVEMVIQECDLSNRNGRKYPKEYYLHHEEIQIDQIVFEDRPVGFSLVKK